MYMFTDFSICTQNFVKAYLEAMGENTSNDHIEAVIMDAKFYQC